MKDLRNKVAVITGAGSGIGRALALQLAMEGCKLALVDISEAGLQETRQLLPANVPATTHIASVSDKARMEALPAEIEQAHGAIHLLFNNAGITIHKSFEQHSMNDIERMMGINLWGVLYGCYFFLPYLKKQGEGHIINTSSLAGYIGLPSQSTYSLTKAAVKALSESLYAELAVHNIGVTSIHPGTIRTNIMNTALSSTAPDTAEETRKLAALMQRFGMPPEKLARKVVAAIKANRMQVRIGIDCYLVDWFKRLFPVLIHLPFKMAFAKVIK